MKIDLTKALNNNQFVVNFIRINIVYPNPMKAIDLTQLS